MRKFLVNIVKLPLYVALWFYAMFNWVFYVIFGLVGLYCLLWLTLHGLELFFMSDFVNGYGHVLGVFVIAGFIFLPFALLQALFGASNR